eukprot:180411_1
MLNSFFPSIFCSIKYVIESHPIVIRCSFVHCFISVMSFLPLLCLSLAQLLSVSVGVSVAFPDFHRVSVVVYWLLSWLCTWDPMCQLKLVRPRISPCCFVIHSSNVNLFIKYQYSN